MKKKDCLTVFTTCNCMTTNINTKLQNQGYFILLNCGTHNVCLTPLFLVVAFLCTQIYWFSCHLSGNHSLFASKCLDTKSTECMT